MKGVYLGEWGYVGNDNQRRGSFAILFLGVYFILITVLCVFLLFGIKFHCANIWQFPVVIKIRFAELVDPDLIDEYRLDSMRRLR